MKRYGSSLILVLLCVLFAAPAANAQWVKNGVPVGYADYNQETPVIVSDGASGAMIAWSDFRSGVDKDIYGNRITADGIVLGGSGVPLCAASGDQYNPGAILDGMGSAIVIWIDYRTGNPQIYAQRIDTTGNVYWPTDGISVCPGVGYISGEARVVSDGVGGAIIVWADSRSGNDDIYAQRVGGDGTLHWGDSGRAVCTYSETQQLPEMASDGSGGAIIAWVDYRNYQQEIYVQRLDGNGNILWTADGVHV